MAALKARAAVLRAVRDYFHDSGFLEVETPARVRAPGQEVHLDAVPADGRWLITSPEYHMKRLVAGGAGPIFQICKTWRKDEVGPEHQPEFTMLEWYRPGEPLERIAEDCEAVVAAAARAAGGWPQVAVPESRRREGARVLQLEAPFERTTVAELARRHAGIALRGDESAAELRERVLAAGVRVGSATAWDDVFYQLWLDRIESRLGVGRPTFVFDWPLPLGALARRKPGAPVVERFELYAAGLELANAFGELTDPVEQRARFEQETRERAARGKVVYAMDEKLLDALGHMPPTAGVALGFDRLVMLVLGAASMDQVMAFPADAV